MKTAWHGILIAGYALLAAMIALLLPALLPETAGGIAILLAIVSFMACALAHEIFTRRQNDAQTVRRMLALKKAYDLQKEELQQALADIRSQGGRRPAPRNPISDSEDFFRPDPPVSGSDFPSSRPAPAEDRPPQPMPRQAAPRQVPPRPDRMHREMPLPDARPERPPLHNAPEDEDEPLFPEQRQVQKAGGQSGLQTKELQDMEAEVKVLHSLVEQLYNDDGLYGRKTESAPAPEPVKPKRRGLRIVGKGSDSALLDTVREGLRHDRIDLYLQPIVSLPQRKRRFYECFSRIRAADGAVIKPQEYMPVAEKEGLVAAIDNMLLFRSVQLLRKVRAHDYSMAFFCNVSPYSLGDEKFLKEFISYMESHQDLAPSLVMELKQGDVPDDLNGLSPQMDRLGRMGYRFALNSVTDFDLDFKELQRHHFHFVKVDAKALINRFKESPAGGEIRSFKQQLDDKGIDMIVENIETEQMLIELLDFNIDYGQGFLFGEPRISKDPTTGMRAI
ncbi:EAL domain-containing protein [Aestuariispira insulae]|uniref:EAL domain-containing protein (Putative c-di-GMP-specific phosphodiesterase class I) n=1 Tax=Aestuariispira insulae TaxID=1461337 RepID=A0A3D9HEX2_9PROT|nr:EAL domain-containing protein [Aestuariispira insulae]RED48030.1 EAL domain-containing protein (putative c-di-GMP-specific phosphodiesterase class I) [Aestuariispira insulae]